MFIVKKPNLINKFIFKLKNVLRKKFQMHISYIIIYIHIICLLYIYTYVFVYYFAQNNTTFRVL